MAAKKRPEKPDLQPVYGCWMNKTYLPEQLVDVLLQHMPQEDCEPKARDAYFQKLSESVQEFEVLRPNLSAGEIRELLMNISGDAGKPALLDSGSRKIFFSITELNKRAEVCRLHVGGRPAARAWGAMRISRHRVRNAR